MEEKNDEIVEKVVVNPERTHVQNLLAAGLVADGDEQERLKVWSFGKRLHRRGWCAL